jgi:hypothetical protein
LQEKSQRGLKGLALFAGSGSWVKRWQRWKYWAMSCNDVYRIDLSSVIDKYIGRNRERISSEDIVVDAS